MGEVRRADFWVSDAVAVTLSGCAVKPRFDAAVRSASRSCPPRLTEIDRGRVRDPCLDAERRIARRRRQRVLGAGPRRLDDLPRVGGRFVGVDEQRAGRALPRRLLELVGPAAVVGQRLAAEQGRLVGRRRRVVDHHQHPLPLHVDAGVVVPFLLGGDDAVADEHHLAAHRDLGVLDAREGDDVVTVLVGAAGHAQREAAIDHRFDDRHLLEVGAAVAGRRESGQGQLRRQVLGGQFATARRRRPPFEQVVRQVADVRGNRRGGDLGFGRTR